MNPPLNRRQFLAAGAAATAALALAPSSLAAEAATTRHKLIAFTKPFDKFSPGDTADLVADVGWDGVELGIRDHRGHVLPAKVEDDLPKMADALKKRDREITIATTEIVEINPLNERVLRTCARLGIRQVRLGFFKYARNQPFDPQLAEMRAKLKDISAICGELGLQAGFQNHSGADRPGAGLWDLWSLIKDIDPKRMGVFFDIGHATIEGGLSWPTEARLMRPHLGAVYVKDFLWKKEGEAWKMTWVPLGEGMVSKTFFKWLKETNYTGPVCQHHEYFRSEVPLPDLKAALKKDLETLRKWLV
jgi:sugar phosphate isomerase/epimerase